MRDFIITLINQPQSAALIGAILVIFYQWANKRRDHNGELLTPSILIYHDLKKISIALVLILIILYGTFLVFSKTNTPHSTPEVNTIDAPLLKQNSIINNHKLNLSPSTGNHLKIDKSVSLLRNQQCWIQIEAFSSKALALGFAKNIQQSRVVFDNNTQMFCVAISFQDQNTAKKNLSKIRSQYGQKSFIKMYHTDRKEI